MLSLSELFILYSEFIYTHTCAYAHTHSQSHAYINVKGILHKIEKRKGKAYSPFTKITLRTKIFINCVYRYQKEHNY